MVNASLVPSLDADIHLVLCRFGRAGLAYIETDPAEADATTVVQNLLHGRYGWPLRVIALNVDEGWSRDVSEAMARKVHEIAEREDYELTEGTLAFMEAHSPRVVQPTLPLWWVRRLSHFPTKPECAAQLHHRLADGSGYEHCRRADRISIEIDLRRAMAFAE
jgi:hypothetical protein